MVFWYLYAHKKRFIFLFTLLEIAFVKPLWDESTVCLIKTLTKKQQAILTANKNTKKAKTPVSHVISYTIEAGILNTHTNHMYHMLFGLFKHLTK